MPIIDYSFESGIFFARETGDLSEADATEWAERLESCAASSPTPVAAVVDALEAGYAFDEAREIFARASYTTNLLCVAVASHPFNETTARVIGLLGKLGHTHVFATVEEAYAYARRCLQSTQSR